MELYVIFFYIFQICNVLSYIHNLNNKIEREKKRISESLNHREPKTKQAGGFRVWAATRDKALSRSPIQGPGQFVIVCSL